MALLALSIIFASTYGFFAFSLNGRTVHWLMLRPLHPARGKPWPADTNIVDLALVCSFLECNTWTWRHTFVTAHKNLQGKPHGKIQSDSI